MHSDPLELLQLAALYHAANGEADIVFSIIDVDDLEPGKQQDLASIIVSIAHDGQVTPMEVFSRASKVSGDLANFFAVHVREEHYGTPTYCANAVRDAANRRRITASVTRAYQALTATQRPVEEVVAELGSDLDVAEATLSSGLGIIDFEEMIATPDDYRQWIVPQMLRTNERLIVTGPEGGGKSVLVAQMCMGAATGVNTLDPNYGTHEPLRVLMLDVENDRLQIKANVAKVAPVLERLGGQRPLIEWVDVRDINLADPVERQKVIRLAKERQPQLMYLGSLYKLAPEGEKADAQFTHVSRTVDRIRAETGTAVMLEAHTGHGLNNDRNGAMRPYGSSMWLRWPEFGMAMIHHRHKPVQIKHWRGARSDDRVWPGGLHRGGVLPWTAIGIDEWEARYEDK